MIRTTLAGLLGGVALYFVGFIFWGTPLATLAFARVEPAQSAAVQTALAQNLTLTGTGTYVVPDPSSPQGTTLFGKGPVATIHFNTGGFPVVDGASLTAGFILALIVGLLLAFGLSAVSGFAARVRLLLLSALAFLVWTHLGQPVFNHYGWGYFIYLFLADFIGFVAAGLVIAKLLPAPVEMKPAEARTDA